MCFHHIIITDKSLKRLTLRLLFFLFKETTETDNQCLNVFYPQCHLVSAVWARSSGPKDNRMGLRRPSSCPRGCAAPRLCVGGTTACPGSTLSHTASRGPDSSKGAGFVNMHRLIGILTFDTLNVLPSSHRLLVPIQVWQWTAVKVLRLCYNDGCRVLFTVVKQTEYTHHNGYQFTSEKLNY